MNSNSNKSIHKYYTLFGRISQYIKQAIERNGGNINDYLEYDLSFGFFKK